MGCNALSIFSIQSIQNSNLGFIVSNKINKSTLIDIWKHHRSLQFKNKIKGLNYERCAELPYIIDLLRPGFNDSLNYLDIGSGESPLPSYLLKNTRWNITCLDKHFWVRKQKHFVDLVWIVLFAVVYLI